MQGSAREWNHGQKNRDGRLARAVSTLGSDLRGKLLPAERVVDLLHSVIESGDRVCLEGNNQKQADFLAGALCAMDPARVHDLHMLLSVLALPEHLDIFDKGIASKLDFSFSGPQAVRLARLVADGKLNIGAIHTYLELFGRYFIDLTPRVALIAAQAADRQGNLYTGPNTEDTPAIVEATAFKSGIVIAQVNEIVDVLPRVDVPADWVDFVVQAPTPHYIEPLFTRDPALISEVQVLMAMMAIKGIYAEYGVERINHGIGFDTAAIELILPTYAESLGLKGKIGRHWALNPHPALIPNSGWNVISKRVRISFSSDAMAPCAAIVRCRKRPACMPAICSSARHCRLICRVTRPPQRWVAFRVLVVHRIWVLTHADDATRVLHG